MNPETLAKARELILRDFPELARRDEERELRARALARIMEEVREKFPDVKSGEYAGRHVVFAGKLVMAWEESAEDSWSKARGWV